MELLKLKSKSKSLDIAQEVEDDLNKYFEQFSKLKKEEEEIYFGVVWKNTSEYRPFENTVFEIIETEVPILSDGFPAPTVKTLDPDRQAAAKNLEKALTWVNKDQDLILKYPELIRSALVAGPGWLFPHYDNHAKNGEGAEIYEKIHWRNVKISGETDDIAMSAKAQFSVSRSKDWLKLEYPDKTKEIENLKASDSKKEDGDRGLESTDSGAGFAKRSVPKPYTDSDTFTLTYTFVRDFTMVPIPEKETLEEMQKEAEKLTSGEAPNVSKYQDHESHNKGHFEHIYSLYQQLGLEPDAGSEMAYDVAQQLSQDNEEAAEHYGNIALQIKVLESHMIEHEEMKKLNPKGQKLKYGGGYRQIDKVESIALYDGKNKFWHKELPLVPFYAYRDGTIYGSSEIRNLVDSVRMQAVMDRKVYKGLQRVANPAVEVNEASGLTKDDISNEDGAVYNVKDGTTWTMRQVSAGTVNPQVAQFSEARKERMRDISGMKEPTRGEMPSGNMSEVSVLTIQSQALGRIRLKDRQNKYFSLKRLGRLVAHDIVQNWTTEKVLELEDQNGNYEEVIYNPLEVDDLDFDIEIDTDAMSGADKDKLNAYYTSLLNSGHITFAQYSQLVDLPKVGKMQEFAAENDKMKAEMQGAAQQIEQMKMENIRLKAAISEEALSSEERQVYEQMVREQLLAQETGANYGQPEGAI